jgi:hypothetical protein
VLDLVGHRAREQIGDIDLAALERGRARRLLHHRSHDEPLHRRRLSPVLVERLEHELDPRCERDDLVGAGADRGFLEAVLADLVDVMLGHDPAGAGGGGAVEQHEIGPRFLEDEADLRRGEDLDLLDLLLQQGRARALVSLERELHVLGRER